MRTEKLSILYPDRPGFILFAHDMKLLSMRFFDTQATITVHERDSLKILLNDTTIHRSESVRPSQVDRLQVINTLSESIPPVADISPQELKGSGVKNSQIEKE